jgi:GT2 family glycosyltransferase
MLLSIVIPTHRRPDMLKKCLESIFSNKLKKNYEVLVISDCNDKKTASLMREIISHHDNVYYFKQKNSGPAASRNLGIANVIGKIITFLDDDCIVDKDWIEKIVQSHKKNVDILVIAGAIIPRSKSLISEFSQSLEARADIKNNKYFYPSIINNNSYKKSVFRKVKNFDTSFRKASGEDVEFNYKLHKAGIRTLFKNDIRVYHKYKTSLWPFLNQQFWFGHERIKMMKKADDYPFKKNPKILYILKRLVTPIADPWLRLSFAIRHKRRCALLYLPLGYLQQMAYWSGFVVSLFKE